MTFDDFLHLVDRAIGARGAPDLEGKPNIVLCGVRFWRDGPTGVPAYAEPEENWDTEAMIAELTVLLAPQSVQERAARQAGWNVRHTAQGWRYGRADAIEAHAPDAPVFASESEAWQGVCDACQLIGPDIPADAWERVARAAGYRVHSWEAVENGDEADSYYWASATASAGASDLVDTFATEALAWRDCCIREGLLRAMYDRQVAAGIEFDRNTMGGWSWRSRGDGQDSGLFETLPDAVVDCEKQRALSNSAPKVSHHAHEMTQNQDDFQPETVSY